MILTCDFFYRQVARGLEAGRLRAARDCGNVTWEAGAGACPSLATHGHVQGLQGGAALLKRGPGFDAFVDAWFGAYVYYYEKELASSAWGHDNQLGADQPPLREVAKERCRGSSNATFTIGALPANYNVRFLHPPTDGDLVLKRGSANVSDSLYGALDGPAVVLHSHFYWQCASPASRARVDGVGAHLTHRSLRTQG